MTPISLGDAIKSARVDYGARVENVDGRVRLSKDRLWELCREQPGGDKQFRLIAAGGREKVTEFENGRTCPTKEQLRILEKVLGLEPHELDQYPPKQQLDRASRTAKALKIEPLPPHISASQEPKTLPAPKEVDTAPATMIAPLRDWLADLSAIDPIIEAGLRAPPESGRRFALPLDSDIDDQDIKALRRALRDEPRLIVVTGEPFLGKKAKVKGLLRLIAERSDALSYDLAIEGKTVERLPIRAWSARRLHYRELVERVHDFLEQYHYARAGHQAQTPTALPMPERGRTFDELIERINMNFRDLPAVFIFTDVDAFGANHARNVVRDIGIEQLIRTLLDANKVSRIIITTTDFETRSRRNRQLINFPMHQVIPIEPPHFSEVKNFVRRDIRSAVSLLKFYDHDAQVRGDDLVGLAALINLTYLEEEGSLPEEIDTAIGRFLNADRELRDGTRRDIYSHIVKAIVASGLLHPIALVAASEDGVQPDSMRCLLRLWCQQNEEVPEFSDDDAVNAALAVFAMRVGSRFLQRVGIARYDDEEYDFDERHGPQDLVWEMNPSISMYFLDALRNFDPTIPAYAHRLIARFARLRSQQKKMLMRTPVGSRASEEGSRDIQCYVNLLASILFQDDDDSSIEGPPLRLSETEIFAIDKRFSAARALRFAVFCLLKEDIDHDYRLTMVFDEDALRLDLFLLLFQKLGRVYTPEVEPLELPAALPDHLTNGIFSPDEILDLMSTIALSAYHAQRSNVVDGIVALASTYVAERGIAKSEINLSRLWCCKIDASIRRGSLNDTATSGHLETLGFVRELRRLWYVDLADSIPAVPTPPDTLSRHEAHLRLLIREADLTSMVEVDRSQAAALYDQVEKIEAALSKVPEQHNPVVLSGRSGRRYIQFLLTDRAIIDPKAEPRERRDQIFEKIEALLSVNKARLRRFSGADRVGVMLDTARLRLARGDFCGAHHYAESAKRRAFSGSVSHGGKLDVFQVLTEVKLSLVEHGDAAMLPKGYDTARLLKEARIAIRNLRSIAEHLRYAPAHGMAHTLEARLALASDAQRRRRSGPPVDNLLRDARKAIRHARAMLKSIGQVNLDTALDAMDEEARRRLELAHTK